mmetsp:Transcript_72592/g.212759  ORF Transcript_72592/g.212759 Transcript_72592/m.212759 type:complete len:237 (+) Transcript_72592:207-917(+)
MQRACRRARRSLPGNKRSQGLSWRSSHSTWKRRRLTTPSLKHSLMTVSGRWTHLWVTRCGASVSTISAQASWTGSGRRAWGRSARCTRWSWPCAGRGASPWSARGMGSSVLPMWTQSTGASTQGWPRTSSAMLGTSSSATSCRPWRSSATVLAWTRGGPTSGWASCPGTGCARAPARRLAGGGRSRSSRQSSRRGSKESARSCPSRGLGRRRGASRGSGVWLSSVLPTPWATRLAK